MRRWQRDRCGLLRRSGCERCSLSVSGFPAGNSTRAGLPSDRGLLVTSCTDSSPTPSATSAATSTSTSPSTTPRERSDRLPDPVDPESFAKTTPANPAQLPQLIGLTEDEAREWAELPGFTLVNRADSYPDVFAPTQRILVYTDENGIVTSATAS